MLKMAMSLNYTNNCDSPLRKAMTWHHGKEFYGNNEGRKWWLSDIRNGVKSCPSWWFYTAKEAKEAAEIIVLKPCGA